MYANLKVIRNIFIVTLKILSPTDYYVDAGNYLTLNLMKGS